MLRGAGRCWRLPPRLLLMLQALVTFASAFSSPKLLSSTLRRQTAHSSTSLRVSHFSSAVVCQPTFMVSGGTFEDKSLFDDLNDEEYDDEDAILHRLDYLPFDLSSLPPLTLQLLQNATDNHIYGKAVHPVHVWDVIASEYQSFDVPVQIQNQVIDVRNTGEQLDESLAELLSLGALHRLPKEIVAQLLGSACASAQPSNASATFEMCLEAFSSQGWSAVSFPQGLAIRPKQRKYRRGSSSSVKSTLLWFRNRKRRVEFAEAAVAEAQTTIPPSQKISREELLAKIQQQLGELSASEGIQYELLDRLYFPDSMPTLPFSWKRIKRLIDKQYAKLKNKGRVGLLAYCFFNFLFYSIGVLWQWPRIPPAHPLSSSVSVVVFRKFCRVFGSLYISSQFFKLPKLVAAVALLPLSSKCLSETRKRLRLSESLSTFVLVSTMVALWSGIVAIPILREYTRLRRFVQLERLLSLHEVVPAFYYVTQLGLREC